MIEKLTMFNGDWEALCIALIRENKDLKVRLEKMRNNLGEYQKVIKDYRIEAGITHGPHKH